MLPDHPLLEMLRMVFILSIVIFCVFRVAESSLKRTFLPELVGYVLAAIGAFWQACVFARWLVLGGIDLATQDILADLAMFSGVALILWSATCWRLRRSRRSGEEAPRVYRREDDAEEHRPC